ncbi:MAG: hypothetical protein WCM76_11370 [Bacteroidota bacterium]
MEKTKSVSTLEKFKEFNIDKVIGGQTDYIFRSTVYDGGAKDVVLSTGYSNATEADADGCDATRCLDSSAILTGGWLR